MKKIKSTGKLIAIDMYNCDGAVLKAVDNVEETLRQACNEYSMQVREIFRCIEDAKSEYSLSAICKQGHVTLHIYPEIGFATADVFSCCEGADSAGMARHLRRYLNSDKAKITLLDRVDFGSESDMKPHRRSTMKIIRRTQNLGGKLKKIIMRPRSI